MQIQRKDGGQKMINAKLKNYATVSAVVTRADGTVEDLGIIATGKKQSMLKRFWLWLTGRSAIGTVQTK